MQPETTKPVETDVIEAEAHQVQISAQQMVRVTCAEDMTIVAGRVRLVKDMVKKVKDHYAAMKKPAKATLDAIVAQEKGMLAPLEAEETRLRRIADEYSAEEARKVRLETERKQAELRAQAEEARIAAIERQKALDEDAKVFGEEAPPLDEEVLNELDRARELEHQAKKATVGAALKEAGTHAAGTSVVTRWRYEVVDKALVPDEYWTIDADKVEYEVKKKKGACDIPGIRVFPETKTRFA